MRLYLTLVNRYLSKYYENGNTFTGVSYFFRLYHLTQMLDFVYLKNYSITRKEVRTLQQIFRDYWQEEINNDDVDVKKEKLMKMFSLCETLLPYITMTIHKLETYTVEQKLDTGFGFGKWRPLLIAVEHID